MLFIRVDYFSVLKYSDDVLMGYKPVPNYVKALWYIILVYEY